jgi:NAD(P)H-flavin reductase
LLHVSRTLADLPLRTDFVRFADETLRITYVPVVSNSVPNDWRSAHGRIDEAMVRKYVPDLNQPIYYLAGPEGMVKAMRQLLVGLKANGPVHCSRLHRRNHDED